MDVVVQAAIVGAVFTLFASVLTALVNYYRGRSEREQWQRTLELEKRRLDHDELKWALELNNSRELAIHDLRIETYPEIFGELERLSSHNLIHLSRTGAREVADKLNAWGYGKSGLCMLPDTRVALFALRNQLMMVAIGEESVENILRSGGPRVDLIELMRRDLNHDWSPWREFKPLIQVNRERIESSLKASPALNEPNSQP